MTIYCEYTDKNESTISIGGIEYWDTQQFANLTQRSQGTIRLLVSKGNRVRKLKGDNINGRLYIRAEELTEFPFVIKGRPYEMGDFIERFYLENGALLREEVMLKKEEVTEETPASTEA